MRSAKATFLTLVLAPALAAGGDGGAELPRGEVLPREVCGHAPDQSYALYLPRAYRGDSPFPIIYVLDPAARGALAVDRFREAAESRGYVVAASNNARNGPPEPVAEAVRAMAFDLERRVAIDARRVYLAGFSGGARAAWALASASGAVAGVVGCGAGTPPGREPGPRPSFDFVGIVGTEDMNYLELSSLDRRLAESGAAHRLLLFDGGHQWPPPDLCEQALAWLDRRAMARGLRPRDQPTLDAMLLRALAEARALEDAGRTDDALRAYQAIEEDFRGLASTDAAEAAALRLGSDPSVKKLARDHRRIESRESSLRQRLDARFAALRDGPAVPRLPPDQRQLWQAEVRSMRATRQSDRGDPHEEAMVRRLQDYLRRRAAEDAAAYAGRGQPGKAVAVAEVAVMALPDHPGARYDLACALARAGRPDEALDALGEAVARGFADRAHAENDPDLASLRATPRYRELLEAMASSSPSPGTDDVETGDGSGTRAIRSPSTEPPTRSTIRSSAS